jgi:GT2 family glycosyltransferase
MKIALVSAIYFKTERQIYFAEETLKSIRSADHQLDIIGVVNYATPESRTRIATHYTTIIDNDKNNLSRAWNKGIELAWQRKADYVLLTNLDIIFRPDTIDNLVAAAQSTPDAVMWSTRNIQQVHELLSTPVSNKIDPGAHFSCFMIDRKFCSRIGDFDERFEPAYFEDSDITRRILLAEQRLVICNASMVSHYGGATINGFFFDNNQEELHRIDQAIKTNEGRYIEKWGGLPGKETLTVPR